MHGKCMARLGCTGYIVKHLTSTLLVCWRGQGLQCIAWTAQCRVNCEEIKGMTMMMIMIRLHFYGGKKTSVTLGQCRHIQPNHG